ncbi:MAG: hypothetical protein WAT74_12325 [Flavobacteriales bacterium]
MKLQHLPLNLFAMVALVVSMALTGCSKDDGFAPCQHQEENNGNAKMMGGNATEYRDAQGRNGTRGTDGDSSISDDGDDVGDGERNRKKKPNS